MDTQPHRGVPIRSAIGPFTATEHSAIPQLPQTSAFFVVLRAIGRVRIEESGKIRHSSCSAKRSRMSFRMKFHLVSLRSAGVALVDLSPVGQINGLPTIHPARIDVARGTAIPSTSANWIPLDRRSDPWFPDAWGYGRLWVADGTGESDFPKSRFQSIARSAWVAIPVVMALVFVCWIAYLETYPEEEPFPGPTA